MQLSYKQYSESLGSEIESLTPEILPERKHGIADLRLLLPSIPSTELNKHNMSCPRVSRGIRGHNPGPLPTPFPSPDDFASSDGWPLSSNRSVSPSIPPSRRRALVRIAPSGRLGPSRSRSSTTYLNRQARTMLAGHATAGDDKFRAEAYISTNYGALSGSPLRRNPPPSGQHPVAARGQGECGSHGA